MSVSVDQISVEWTGSLRADLTLPSRVGWGVERLDRPPRFQGPKDEAWFNNDEWSGVETPSWLAWISNKGRSAVVWGVTEEIARRDALAVVVPAALRREGFLDGHGAVIAPDATRPHDAVFVTGLSGSGKSSLTVSCALGRARFLSDDSVAIGFAEGNLRAWSRRSALSLSAEMHRELIPAVAGRAFEDKLVFDSRATFPDRCADSLQVRAIVFLERGLAHGEGPVAERTTVAPVESASAYKRLLMGHPILAVDKGARPSFKVVRSLANLPCHRMTGGRDLLDPRTACDTLAALLPPHRAMLR